MAEINIQVLDPAEVTLPLNVNQLAFMNRSVDPFLLRPDSSQWTKEEYYILDTIVNNWIFMGLRNAMTESPLYEMDTIQVIRSQRRDTSNMLKPPEIQELHKIKEVQQADAIISLEYYTIFDSINVSFEFSDGYFRKAYFGLISTTVWRIFDLNNDTIIDYHIQKDTMEWYAYADETNEALAMLPRAVGALREAAMAIGQRYGNRISPVWLGDPRFYYKGGSKEMRSAGKMAASGDWEGAAEIWSKMANEETAKIAAKASFNMALVCEMEDLLLPAMDWAIKSYSIEQKSLTKEYINLLQKRYEDRKKLRMQVPLGDGLSKEFFPVLQIQ